MCVRDKYIVGIVAYAVVIVAVFALRPGGNAVVPLAAAAMDLISISIAVLLGLSAVRYFRLSTRQGKSMAFLTAGLFVWLLSEALWVTAERINGAAATDTAFVLAYPFFIAGILYGFRTLGLSFRREMLLTPVLVVVLLTATVVMIILWNQNVAGASLATTFTIYAFAISNTALLIPVFLLIRRAFSGFFSRPWMLVALALTLNVAGQALLAFMYDAYKVGSPVDILTFFSYLAFGAAFVVFEHDTRMFVDGVRDGKHKKGKETAKKREYKRAGRKK